MRLSIVDAFTSEPFTGNPAAVALVDAMPDPTRMQLVAREMSLSETAFCAPRGDGSYDLRWFTPATEVALCGHATLATAHILGGDAVFETASGTLRCRRGGGGELEMDFPADPPQLLAAAPPGGTAAVPGARSWARGRFDLLAEVEDERAVEAFQPDQTAIAALGGRGLVLTAAGGRSGVDVVSRFFAPCAGVPEDPVTGSAHCLLACYWGDRLGRDELAGEQLSERGGRVRMRRQGDRVVLGGHAVTVAVVELSA